MILNNALSRPIRLLAAFCGLLILGTNAFGQSPKSAAVERGSQTAKQGFKNEDEIRDKFNNWKTDQDAQSWLLVMGYKAADIEYVAAAKPHGEKADVEVRIRTKAGEKTEGISIKLVSSPTGFNQIDKRWLSTYAKMWKMPANVQTALKYFLGETPPSGPGRDSKRMFLTELSPDSQKAIVDFFSTNRTQIVSDLFEGDGIHAAGWVMVALKVTANTRWALRKSAEVIQFFGDGPVVITKQGNLKIGRITMQRKGGDGGRETAKMLQFKINPALFFGDH
jgi:hypothetical protein